MTIETITPRKDCRYCHGTGQVNDWVDYGSTTVSMPSICDCVTEQAEYEDSVIEIVPEGATYYDEEGDA